MSDKPQGSTERFRSRLGSRFVIALVAGPLVGLAIGAIIGLVFFEPGGRGFTMSLVGTAIGITLLCLLWAGYSSLESPDPGQEPSDTRRPIADRDELVREEHDDGSTASPRT